jgi:hypothetical protein
MSKFLPERKRKRGPAAPSPRSIGLTNQADVSTCCPRPLPDEDAEAVLNSCRIDAWDCSAAFIAATASVCLTPLPDATALETAPLTTEETLIGYAFLSVSRGRILRPRTRNSPGRSSRRHDALTYSL